MTIRRIIQRYFALFSQWACLCLKRNRRKWIGKWDSKEQKWGPLDDPVAFFLQGAEGIT